MHPSMLGAAEADCSGKTCPQKSWTTQLSARPKQYSVSTVSIKLKIGWFLRAAVVLGKQAEIVCSIWTMSSAWNHWNYGWPNWWKLNSHYPLLRSTRNGVTGTALPISYNPPDSKVTFFESLKHDFGISAILEPFWQVTFNSLHLFARSDILQRQLAIDIVHPISRI
jgi:hypothetical protein